MAENHHIASEPPQGARDLPRWAASLLLMLLVPAFYWKLVLTNQFTWLAGDDTAFQVLPWLQFQAGEWHAGRFPLWDPNQWMGQPLIGQAQPGTSNPLNWILFSMPLRDGWMKQIYLHWYMVIIHMLAAWFGYRLARSMRASRGGSLLGGLAFTLAAWMGTNDWPQMLCGAIYAPLVFLFVFRASAEERPLPYGILGGFFLGLAWLSGHHQIPIFVSLAAAGVQAAALWRPSFSRARLLSAWAAFWAAAGCGGALLILPAAEYGRLSVRWVGAETPVGWGQKIPYAVHSFFSLGPESLLGILFPGMYRHTDPNIGITVFLLALLGAIVFWSKREVRWMAGVGLFGLFVALGTNSPLHGWLYSVMPVVEKARNVSTAVFLFGLAASMLAALGADALLREDARQWVRRAAGIGVSIAVLVFSLRLGIAMMGVGASGDNRALVTALCGLLSAAVFVAASNGRLLPVAAYLLLIGLFLAEINNTNEVFLPTYSEKERVNNLSLLASHGDIAAFLKSKPTPARFALNRDAIPYNFGDWYGLPQMDGYLASMTANLANLNVFNEEALRLLGTEYFIAAQPWGPFTEEVFGSKSGVKVFRDAKVMPRAFVVHEVVSKKKEQQSAAKLYEMRDVLAQRTFVNGTPPQLEQCSERGVARIEQYNSSSVKIAARMPCRGMVVLSDTYFPGWEARVDGQKAQIHEAYGALRGVVVDRGRHTIEFVYHPRSVMAGAALSAASLLAALAAAASIKFGKRGGRSTRS